jgi:hypothetical protein
MLCAAMGTTMEPTMAKQSKTKQELRADGYSIVTDTLTLNVPTIGDVDVYTLEPHAVAYLLQHGVTKSASDSTSGWETGAKKIFAGEKPKRKSDESLFKRLLAIFKPADFKSADEYAKALVNEGNKRRWQAIVTGNLGTRSRVDTRTKVYYDVAEQYILARAKKKPELPTKLAERRAFFDKIIAAKPEWVEAINAETDRRMAFVPDDDAVDLEELSA